MEASLTFAKITAPLVDTVVERSRLLASLDCTSGHKLTWISGPAGCGKTTLTADYVRKSKAQCLWYQVDHGDGDPAVLFHYLRLAAQTKTKRSRRSLPPEFSPEFFPGLEVFARRFFRDLFARLSSPFVIVFDNLQDAPPDSAFYGVLREGLSELPSGGQALLVSRSQPPPNFSTFLARREMTVVGWEDLRFTETEVEEFFGLFGQKTRFQDQVQNILSFTQGWVAGVVLLTAFADEMELSSLTPGKAPVKNLFDYFATEVFRKVDAVAQSFLLRSSFLPEMTVHQAEDITANPDAGKILARLSRENFFTTRRSGRQPIYQYHPLFREFLQNRAQALLSSDSLAVLRGKAPKLLEAAG
jgi:LuxR family transcriptional regulator, maltose regulon positive regulatory protein